MSATGRFTFRAETSGIESFAFVGRYFMRSLLWTKRAWIASKKASLKVRTKKENALITMSKTKHRSLACFRILVTGNVLFTQRI